MLVSAWNTLTTETIVNCFRKAGIFTESQEAEEANHFKELHDEIDVLRSVQPYLIEQHIDATSLIDIDSEVAAKQPTTTTYSEILG